jgi:hypothetical protein
MPVTLDDENREVLYRRLKAAADADATSVRPVPQLGKSMARFVGALYRTVVKGGSSIMDEKPKSYPNDAPR